MRTGELRPRIKETIIVEGKHDKSTLSRYFDADIVELGGFRIYKRKDMLELIRKLALKNGVIILTDSDSAGFAIRGYLKGALPEGSVKHAYIPDIGGKEKRKPRPSKEGKLGVEAMEYSVILRALSRAGAVIDDIENHNSTEDKRRLSKADLYSLGLCGGSDSKKRRRDLLKSLGLPELLTANSMCDVLNVLYSVTEFKSLVSGKYILDTDGTDCS